MNDQKSDNKPSAKGTLKNYFSPTCERVIKRKRNMASPEEDTAHLVEKQELLDVLSALLESKMTEFQENFEGVERRLDKIEEKLDVIGNENAELKTQLKEIKEENKSLKRNIEYLLMKNKERNLIFKGIPNTGEDKI